MKVKCESGAILISTALYSSYRYFSLSTNSYPRPLSRQLLWQNTLRLASLFTFSIRNPFRRSTTLQLHRFRFSCRRVPNRCAMSTQTSVKMLGSFSRLSLWNSISWSPWQLRYISKTLSPQSPLMRTKYSPGSKCKESELTRPCWYLPSTHRYPLAPSFTTTISRLQTYSYPFLLQYFLSFWIRFSMQLLRHSFIRSRRTEMLPFVCFTMHPSEQQLSFIPKTYALPNSRFKSPISNTMFTRRLRSITFILASRVKQALESIPDSSRTEQLPQSKQAGFSGSESTATPCPWVRLLRNLNSSSSLRRSNCSPGNPVKSNSKFPTESSNSASQELQILAKAFCSSSGQISISPHQFSATLMNAGNSLPPTLTTGIQSSTIVYFQIPSWLIRRQQMQRPVTLWSSNMRCRERVLLESELQAVAKLRPYSKPPRLQMHLE